MITNMILTQIQIIHDYLTTMSDLAETGLFKRHNSSSSS